LLLVGLGGTVRRAELVALDAAAVLLVDGLEIAFRRRRVDQAGGRAWRGGAGGNSGASFDPLRGFVDSVDFVPGSDSGSTASLGGRERDEEQDRRPACRGFVDSVDFVPGIPTLRRAEHPRNGTGRP
jgi:hypothetical protein